MRTLLNQRQKEWMTRSQKQARAAPPPPTERPQLTVREQLNKLRKELNTLVSLHHHRTNKPHGVIHNELRRICGGPPIAAATTDQLRARIEAVRGLQS